MSKTFAPFSIVGYADSQSVVPGDTIGVKVSTSTPGRYRADLVRIICGDITPKGAGFEEEVLAAPFSGFHDGSPQPTNIGSYGVIDLGPDAPRDLTSSSFTLQAAIFPTTPEQGRQGLIGTWCDEPSKGFSLIIDEGELAIIYADETGAAQIVRSGRKLLAWKWQLVAASYDADSRTLSFYQAPLSANEAPAVFQQRQMPLGIKVSRPTSIILAALASNKGASHWMTAHFNGKIDRPRWSTKALTKPQIEELLHASTPPADILGFWDFSRDIQTAHITDLGSNRLHGRVVNLPSRAMTGFNWDGIEFDYRRAPDQYGAIFFHESDLYDAGWRTDFSFTLPDLRSGLYAVRLEYENSVFRIPLFVRPAAGTTKSPIAFIAATATYMAYANSTNAAELIFSATGDNRFLDEVYLTLRDHPEYGRSMYDTHSDGTGIRYSSRLRPLIDVQPGVTKMWSLSADTLITAWLEREGFRFDVLTDEYLDAHGLDALEGYSVVITGSHPEYMSISSRTAFDAQLQRGGRLMYLGGNGFFLRVAYSPVFPGAMEMRRTSSPVPGLWEERPGEDRFSFTGALAGVWQKQKPTPHATSGIGFHGMLTCSATRYVCTPAAANERAVFIFDGETGAINNDFGAVYGALVSDEFDCSDLTQGTPSHALVLATAQMQEPVFKHEHGLRADMTFFETPSGGAVFSTGSISWGLGLHKDERANDIARITRNVLDRFLDLTPFAMPNAD